MRRQFSGIPKGGPQISVFVNKLLLSAAREDALESRNTRLEESSKQPRTVEAELGVVILERLSRLSRSIIVADTETIARVLQEFLDIKDLIPPADLQVLPPETKGTLTAMITNLELGRVNTKAKGILNDTKAQLRDYKYLTRAFEQMVGCYNKLCKLNRHQTMTVPDTIPSNPTESPIVSPMDHEQALQILQGLASLATQYNNFEDFLKYHHPNKVMVPEINDAKTDFATGLQELVSYVHTAYETGTMEALDQTVIFRYQLQRSAGTAPPIFLHTKYGYPLFIDSYSAMTGLEMVFCRVQDTDTTYLKELRIIAA
jgi:hypothetical protein